MLTVLPEVEIMTTQRACGMIVLALALLAAPLQSAEPDRYLPRDAKFVVNVNVRQCFDAPVFKKHAAPVIKAAINGDKELAKLLNTLNFDPLNDVKSIVIAGPGDPQKVLTIIRGKFDLENIETITDAIAQNSEALKITIDSTVRVYQLKSDDLSGYAAFIDPDTLVLSNHREYISQSIFLANDKKKDIKYDKGLVSMLSKADGKKGIWLVGYIPEEAKAKLGENPLTANLGRKLGTFSGGVQLSDAIQSEIQLHADPRTAEELRGALELGRNLLFNAARENKEYRDIIDPLFTGTRIGKAKTGVTISTRLTGDFIDKMLKKAVK